MKLGDIVVCTSDVTVYPSRDNEDDDMKLSSGQLALVIDIPHLRPGDISEFLAITSVRLVWVPKNSTSKLND